MRSFAVIAGFAAAANAYAYGYPAYNSTSVAPPTYETSKAPEYPAYPASSSVGYPAYPVSSKAPEYPSYPSYTTTTVKGLTTVCPEPTTLKVGTKTYTVTKSTTIIDDDCEYTTTVPVKPTPTPVKPSSAPVKPSSAPVQPPVYSTKPVVPYPSKNGTAPTYPVYTGAPTSTKPSPSQFTGAAAVHTGSAAILAIVGVAAALL